MVDLTIYIADTWSHRIRKISPGGIITTVAGTGGLGYSGDNGQATSAQLNNPFGLFVTPTNTIYIVDSSNHCIRVVSPNGIISTIAGNGISGYNGDNLLVTTAQLYSPYAAFVSSDETTYVADSQNQRIRKILCEYI
jgi:hypothetical protein